MKQANFKTVKFLLTLFLSPLSTLLQQQPIICTHFQVMPTHFYGCLATGVLLVNLPSTDTLPSSSTQECVEIAEAIYLHFAEDFHKVLKKYQKTNLEANLCLHALFSLVMKLGSQSKFK